MNKTTWELCGYNVTTHVQGTNVVSPQNYWVEVEQKELRIGLFRSLHTKGVEKELKKVEMVWNRGGRVVKSISQSEHCYWSDGKF